METWPPAPTNSSQKPDLQQFQPQNKARIGYIAFACTVIFVLIRVAIFLGIRNTPLSIVSLLLLISGTTLGIASHKTLLGRLALLGPGFFLALVAYVLLRWYRILPCH